MTLFFTTLQIVEGCCQEREMWRRFARLVQKGDGEGLFEQVKFWQRISMQTQAILDACLLSTVRDGAWVDVVVPPI